MCMFNDMCCAECKAFKELHFSGILMIFYEVNFTASIKLMYLPVVMYN